LQKVGFVMVKRCDGPLDFRGKQLSRQLPEKKYRVGIADPIAIVLRMAATPSVVAAGQICKRAE
jgi:hypothetical protein